MHFFRVSRPKLRIKGTEKCLLNNQIVLERMIEKIAAMEAAGIEVAQSPADMGGAVERAIEKAG